MISLSYLYMLREISYAQWDYTDILNKKTNFNFNISFNNVFSVIGISWKYTDGAWLNLSLGNNTYFIAGVRGTNFYVEDKISWTAYGIWVKYLTQWRRPNDETPFTNSKLKFPISFSKFLGGIAAFPQDDHINYPDAV